MKLIYTIAFISLMLMPSFEGKVIYYVREEPEENFNVYYDSLFSYQVNSIAEAMKLTETGGSLDCTRVGASGEISCFQFLPTTYDLFAKEIYRHADISIKTIPPITDTTAEYVAKSKIDKWLKQGLTPEEIFLTWNQGNTGKCKSGYNSVGTYYNSCEYVRVSMKNLEKVIHRQ